MAASKLFVITGGPGAGKTTLLQELVRRGAICAPEVARQIIQGQVATGGDALPWCVPLRFAEQMLQRSIEQWHEFQDSNGPVFFDRGLPDTLCYARLVGLTSHFQREAMKACLRFRYANTVFLAPAWREIYITDEERKQSYEEAVVTSKLMAQTYADCGYDLFELPRVSVEQRAGFVLDHALNPVRNRGES